MAIERVYDGRTDEPCMALIALSPLALCLLYSHPPPTLLGVPSAPHAGPASPPAEAK